MPEPTLDQEAATGSNISAVPVAVPGAVRPPATKMRPSCNATETCWLRGYFIGGAEETVPSVLRKSALGTGPVPGSPPVTKIWPSGKSAADAPTLALERIPVACHVPLGICSGDAVSKMATQSNTEDNETNLSTFLFTV